MAPFFLHRENDVVLVGARESRVLLGTPQDISACDFDFANFWLLQFGAG